MDELGEVEVDGHCRTAGLPQSAALCCGIDLSHCLRLHIHLITESALLCLSDIQRQPKSKIHIATVASRRRQDRKSMISQDFKHTW